MSGIFYRNDNIKTNKLQMKIADGPPTAGMSIPLKYIRLDLDICVCNPVAPRDVVVGIQVVPDQTTSLPALYDGHNVSPETGAAPPSNSDNLLAAKMVHVKADGCCAKLKFKIPCYWLENGNDLWINSNIVMSNPQFQVNFTGTYQFYYQSPVYTQDNLLAQIKKEKKGKKGNKESEKLLQMMTQLTKMGFNAKSHHKHMIGDSDSD